MSRYILSPLARADLLGAYKFIAAENQPAAERLIDRLTAAMETLAAAPGIGRACHDLELPVRRLVVEKYRIFYAVVEGDDSIQIVRVLHVRRDLRKAMQGE